MAAILRSALSMSVATTLSRITGYARTMTQAAVLGTGAVANAYTLSNALPTQLYELFMGGILSYGVGALATGVLNSHRRFFLPTFAPVLNNLIVIASFTAYALLVASSPTAAVYALAFGTTLGLAVMSLVLVPPAWRLGYRPRPALGHPALRAAVRLAGPVLVFTAATVGVQIAVNLFGSRFGGVEKLWYAFVIFQLPYGVFVVAIATALMPELSEKYSRGDTDGYRETFSFGLRTLAFVVVPSAVGMITLSEPVVGVLYEHLNFDAGDTQIVSRLLVIYGAGLLGYSVYFYL